MGEDTQEQIMSILEGDAPSEKMDGDIVRCTGANCNNSRERRCTEADCVDAQEQIVAIPVGEDAQEQIVTIPEGEDAQEKKMYFAPMAIRIFDGDNDSDLSELDLPTCVPPILANHNATTASGNTTTPGATTQGTSDTSGATVPETWEATATTSGK